MKTPKIQELTTGEQQDETVWPDSQDTIPDDLLPSLNVYSSKSIIVHPSANRELQTLIPKLRIRRPSKFNESPYTMKFGSAAESSEGHMRIFPQKYLFVYHPIDGIVDTKIVNKFMDWISEDLLKVHAKRKENADHYKRGKSTISMMHFGIETVEDKTGSTQWGSLISHEQTRHYSAVLDFIEKLVAISPLCLQYCDFYIKKEVDVENHPRYKDKDSSHMFDGLFQESFPQQPSGSLDCGVYMVTYVECLSYGLKVLANELDPNALRTRYATLL
ncbi:hypothetical protein T459_24947 [Capsicum annuum]|uniref:Ubiquitin-like protease family profile domain-containing protein n=1 Tax=Capsicum annuum TaxID=4072 RepID=A0A2G2YJC3_CAPAN|nr:hypothetical protein T459_24947 [Capsicum annuum]